MTHGELSAAMLSWGLPKIYVDPVIASPRPHTPALFTVLGPHVDLALVSAHRIADVCLAPESERRAMMRPVSARQPPLIEAGTFTTL